MEARITRSRVSSPEFLFNYTQIIVFLKSSRFKNCSHLIYLYIRGYNISWRPKTAYGPSFQNLGVATPNPRIDAYANSHVMRRSMTSSFTKSILFYVLLVIAKVA